VRAAFKTTLIAAALAVLPGLALADSETFTLDGVHSQVGFKVRHFVSKVNGRFAEYEGAVNIDRAKPEASSVDVTIKTASITTDNARRDDHLRSPDFFDAAKYPTITFKSTKIVAKGNNAYDVTGNFTLHGVTKEITVPVSFMGFIKDPRGGEKAGFEASTVINRKDYGIVWNQTLDAGGTVLGDDVTVDLNFEANKKSAAAPPAK
jgi:polyisoprenoid-binding protein YceI